MKRRDTFARSVVTEEDTQGLGTTAQKRLDGAWYYLALSLI